MFVALLTARSAPRFANCDVRVTIFSPQGGLMHPGAGLPGFAGCQIVVKIECHDFRRTGCLIRMSVCEKIMRCDLDRS
jgi:hypothetical protein